MTLKQHTVRKYSHLEHATRPWKNKDTLCEGHMIWKIKDVSYSDNVSDTLFLSKQFIQTNYHVASMWDTTGAISDWFNLCREVYISMKDKYTRRRKIGGLGNIIEIDECKIGMTRHHWACIIEANWILGMIKRSLYVCPETREMLQPCIVWFPTP